LKDILNIDRINRYDEKAGLPATCWNCKTTKMHSMVQEHGDGFWAKDFNEFREGIPMDDLTIGCANLCHCKITSRRMERNLKNYNVTKNVL